MYKCNITFKFYEKQLINNYSLNIISLIKFNFDYFKELKIK